MHYDVMERVDHDNGKLHIQAGNQKRVAFVFSCPGRHEEAAGCPAAKGTGRNLEMLLTLLSIALKRNDLARENITITNAWPNVEYIAKTGRTEATTKEITAPANIQRLQHELQDVTDFIVFCGGRARAVATLLSLENKPKLVYIEHPGLRGLSLIACDVHGEPIIAADKNPAAGKNSAMKRQLQCENTRKRLEVLARDILRQLTDSKKHD